MVLAVIPARYASTRFPGKPLADLHGQTMIERVWRGAIASPAVDRVIVATEDQRVIDECDRIGAEYCMTSADLPSGTDRCHAVLGEKGLTPEIIINIQGDEPLLHPDVLTDLVSAMRTSNADVATPIARLTDVRELDDAGVVKVVRRSDGTALYFSRSPIPHVRGVDKSEWLASQEYWKHIGIYAFRRAALDRHVSLPTSDLERSEFLEQLRLLQDGARFMCVETTHQFIAVDTPEDAARVRLALQ
jgi:3-deoxy-manno-octulosonate cytidylyltransferase (CMP-KDO synthetase)